tara:strand:- start:195 stop:395 length:201 start_codon:yes stop_codon:yes gene_type:complete
MNIQEKQSDRIEKYGLIVNLIELFRVEDFLLPKLKPWNPRLLSVLRVCSDVVSAGTVPLKEIIFEM